MTAQDLTNDPTQPFDGSPAHTDDFECPRKVELTPAEKFFGVMTPKGIALMTIAVGFILGCFGTWTFIVLLWVIGTSIMVIGAGMYLLVLTGVWAVTGDQQLVPAHRHA